MLKSLVSSPSRARRALFGVLALLIGGGVQTTLSLRSNAITNPVRVAVDTLSFGANEWTQLHETGSKVGIVVISPSTGPGISQDAVYLERVQRAQAAGQKVYGFIAAAVTVNSVVQIKSAAAVSAEATLYKSFYGVDGIYLQDVTTSDNCVYLQTLTTAIRSTAVVSLVILRAPTEPGSCVAAHVDIVHLPFLTATDYQNYVPSAWTSGTVEMWHSVDGVAEIDIAAIKTASLTKNVSYLSTKANSSAPTGSYWTRLITEVAGAYTPTPLGFATFTGQNFAMPTYFNDATQWATLTAIGPQFSMAVLNPSSGPGTARDTQIAAQVAAAQLAGIKVVGYVSTNYDGDGVSSHFPLHPVNPAVKNYLDWYGVDGIFYDETSSECSKSAKLLTYTQYLRTEKSGALVVLNPGRNTEECFASQSGLNADVIVNFENTAAVYETWQPSFWTNNYAASRFWHIVYSTAGTDASHVVDLSLRRRGGLLFVSDLSALIPSPTNAFAVLPSTSYLNELRLKIYGSVVNGTTTTTSPTSTTRATISPTSTSTTSTSTTSTLTTSTSTTSTSPTSTSTTSNSSTSTTSTSTTSTTLPTTTTTVAPTTTQPTTSTTTTTTSTTTAPTTTTTTTSTTIAAPAPKSNPTTTPAATTTTSSTTATVAPAVFAPFPSGGGGGGVTIADSSNATTALLTTLPTLPPTSQAPQNAGAPLQSLPVATTTTLEATSTTALPTTTKTFVFQITYSTCGLHRTTTVVNAISGQTGTYRLLTTITCSQKTGLPAKFASVSKVELPSALRPDALKVLAAKIKNSTKVVQGTTDGSVSTVQTQKTLTVTLKGTGNPTAENIIRSLVPAFA